MPVAADPLPYDSLAYAQSLAYLGQAQSIPGLPWPVTRRTIPNSDHFDLLGPWPYGSPPDPAQAPAALAALRATGAVTFVAFLRPDCPVDAPGLQAAGLNVVMLKPHFVYDAGETLPEPSKKTRYNLAAAHRRWTVETLDLGAHWPALTALHDELGQRRQLSRITLLDANHFERLAEVPGATGLCVTDGNELVAALVVMEAGATIHFHTIVGHERAYRERAFYALYAEAVRRWGSDRRLCMGGVPSGADGAGVEKFKRRFATSTRPLLMVTAILDAPACAELAARQGAAWFFPPYRTPAE